MFLELEFIDPNNRKNKTRYNSSLSGEMERTVRSYAEQVVKKDSMLIVPVSIKIIDKEKTYTINVFLSSLADKSGHRLSINKIEKKEIVPQVTLLEDSNNLELSNDHKTFEQSMYNKKLTLIDRFWRFWDGSR